MAYANEPGIRRLESLNMVNISQKATRSANNKYTVLSPDGEVILYAKEKSATLSKFVGGNDRKFKINLYDVDNTEVTCFRRPRTLGPDKMEVTLHGQLVSIVRQKRTFFKPVLNINDANDQPILRVKGPVSKAREVDFRILTIDKQQVGVIYKNWQGWMRGILADRDSYHITFPANAPLDVKATIIGTCFLIDFLYFEH